ncbi:hypothetical protein DM02DRAFT_412868 [Periconia macrospinosa]|uniref:Uncharacterized protein n=1 Tax=Periconia macrospinosa TaxID=97972 RepID=A0A2V1DPC2_9PLEO|nr:hypothetical protein DM02DRAFT_412868 [Periconia macrospinosa]
MPPPSHNHPQRSNSPTQHPLYKLRRITLITAVLGIALSLFAIAILSTYDGSQIPPFLLAIALLFVSLVVVFIDLHTYASRQQSASPHTQPPSSRQNPQHRTSSSNHVDDPSTRATATTISSSPSPPSTWPTKALLITDFVLALLLLWLFWGTFALVVSGGRPWNYYSGGAETFEAYANLANLVASVCHGVAFWKEVVARKRAAWERERGDVEAGWVCAGCGGGRPGEGVADGDVEDVHDGNGEEEDGKVHGFGAMRFPRWATGLGGKGIGDAKSEAVVGGGNEGGSGEAAAAEPLLGTPDESGTEIEAPSASSVGYGTLERSVESVGSVPETVVRKKNKGKKRLVDVE